MKRSKHSLSNYKLATFDMGELVPVGFFEALPGDTIQQSTSMLLRVMPQLGPVMHPVTIRIHHWFVPYRLIFPNWEDFITGGKDGIGMGSAIPTNTVEVTIVKGQLADYFGVPPGIYPIGTMSLLPFRAYNLIYNEFYRDQDLMAERNEDEGQTIALIAWEKDYFTTARPWTQRGPTVTVPIGGTAPVSFPVGTVPVRATSAAGQQLETGTVMDAGSGRGVRNLSDTDTGAQQPLLWSKPDLTGGTADLTLATAQSINALRRAFALQRYAEARAQYGARYVEWLRYYGIRPSDARLQRPEYIGGGKQTISFSEVLSQFGTYTQSTQAPGTTLGVLGGHGVAALRSNRYRYFCEEHGLVLTLCSVKPKSIYASGLHKFWSKRTKEEFFEKELEQIGQQEIYTRELRWSGVPATDDSVFGYQDRYSDYRHVPSTIAGDFRDTFNTWHMARIFGATPVLNQSFVDLVPTKRAFAVQTTDSLFAMCMHSIQARRMVSNRTIGRII